MIYDAPSVLANASHNILDDLADMPKSDPARFQALRLGVARVAARMRYAVADCSPNTPLCDAFAVFKAMVVARGHALTSSASGQRN